MSCQASYWGNSTLAFLQFYTQRKKIKKFRWWMMVCQKVPKSYFQTQFSMSKIDGIFFHLMIPIFEPLYFLKSCPIFDQPSFIEDFFIFFSFEYVDSWPKILLFRIHHLWNPTIELILLYINWGQNAHLNFPPFQ